MINKVNSIKIKYTGNYLVDENRKEKIKRNWIELTKNSNLFHESNILIVTKFEEENLNYYFEIKDTTFSHFMYNKKDLAEDLRCLFSGGYILTSDNYVGAVLNNMYKDNQYCVLNIPGGMADLKDFENENYSYKNNLSREFKEELGIDIDDDNFSIELKYIKYPAENENPIRYAIGIIYEIRTNYTKEKFEKIFSRSEHDNEIKKLVFFTKENYKEIYSYEHVKSYLPELWEKIFNRD